MIILIIISIIGCSFSFSQGLVNNGAYFVVGGNVRVVIDGTLGNYTNKSNGYIKSVNSTSSSGIIHVDGNWKNDGGNVAFSNDGTTVKLTGSNQNITGNSSTTFYNLHLEGTGTKTLQINARVGGISTLTGILSLNDRILDLNSYKLTIANPLGSAITRNNGYIISETNLAINPSIIEWMMATSTGNHVFPFGVSGSYIPFIFDKTTTGSSTVSVSTRATLSSTNLPWAGQSNVGPVTSMVSVGNQSNIPFMADASEFAVIDRWWDITTSSPTTANLTFTYRGIENTTDLSVRNGNFAAQHWNGSNWDPPVGSGPGVTTGTAQVTANGQSTFSPWVLASVITPLPAELIHFSVACDKNRKVITWSTATEKNSDYFTLERSHDGINWTQVQVISGAGTTNSTNHYSIYDYEQSAYYRLLQTDYNGNTKKIGLIQTDCQFDNEYGFTVYPNPSEGTFTISLQSDNKFIGSINIHDVHGKIVFQHPLNVIEGTNNFYFNNSELAQGTYILSIQSQEEKLFTPIKLIIK